MTTSQEKAELLRQRNALASELDRWLEWPMIVLAAVWLVLLVIELIEGISPALERIGLIVWGIFIVEFALRFFLSADKTRFFKNNWFTALTLLLPALRVFRVLRIARALRGVRLVRILGSINRGMNSLGRSMQRRGLPYVVALTVLVLFIGAAGIYAFERNAGAIVTYGDALWWTAMLLTTIGSDYWPQSPEGRLLTLFLSLYALGILGYIAASLAAFFVGQEPRSDGASAGARELRRLRAEIVRLRKELRVGSADDS